MIQLLEIQKSKLNILKFIKIFIFKTKHLYKLVKFSTKYIIIEFFFLKYKLLSS